MNKFLSPEPVWQTFGLTLVRLIFGAFLIYHSWELFSEEKINGYLQWDIFINANGRMMVITGKVTELVAGILFVLGLFTRLACLITIGTFVYISCFVGKGIIWYDDQHPFMFVLLALVFFFTGAGVLSLDAVFFKRK
jgi:putative oxidoreductase